MLQVGQIYEVDGERLLLTDVISTVGGSIEYRLKPAQEFLNVMSSAVSAEVSVLPPGQEAAISYATLTDTDGDDATFVWDPPRVNGILDTRYPDAMDGPIVGRRSQIMMVDDPPDIELETTYVSRSDDGSITLERPRPLHPQIPTGDTYRRVSPNLSPLRTSPAITSVISDSVAVDAAGGQWEISEEIAKTIRDAIANISPSKTPAEPIDNDAWDELFMPAT